jgi:hypothetical protein
MRYCLACRYLSADGPLCTRCGRSFGGRLCNHKKRHLNPPDARYCGECGSQNLTEAANYLSLGCPVKLLLLVGLGAVIWLGIGALFGGGLPGFTTLTGYRSPLVWLIEAIAQPLVLLFVIYVLLGLLPGQVGRGLQKQFAQVCSEIVRFGVSLFCKTLTKLLHFLSGTPTKH